MSCPCDLPPLADARAIAAGLPRLPRAIGDFAAFRRSLLLGIPGQPALAGWRARDRDDLGVMLLEFWAYVADIVAFYDEVFANEAYLRTALRPESVSRLIGLLGYQPRPATAASRGRRRGQSFPGARRRTRRESVAKAPRMAASGGPGPRHGIRTSVARVDDLS